MTAVIELGGKQYRVAQGQTISVERMETAPGESVDIREVLLLDENGKVQVGQPFVQGAKVSAEVLEDGRGPKMHIIKKHPKKRYELKQGHRQNYTLLKITSVSA